MAGATDAAAAATADAAGAPAASGSASSDALIVLSNVRPSSSPLSVDASAAFSIPESDRHSSGSSSDRSAPFSSKL